MECLDTGQGTAQRGRKGERGWKIRKGMEIWASNKEPRVGGPWKKWMNGWGKDSDQDRTRFRMWGEVKMNFDSGCS
jgi:hypothetical protein